MRDEYWQAAFWVFVVGSWTLGFAFKRWVGSGDFFLELGKAVSVPSPLDLSAWWHPLAYFIFTVVAIFVLAQLFFGVGAGIFLFARGVCDGAIISSMENLARGWSFPNIPTHDAWMLVLAVLILAVNLPLTIWSAHIGTQRAAHMWRRLRGQPVKPDTTTKPMITFLVILAASIATGLAAAVAFSYA